MTEAMPDIDLSQFRDLFIDEGQEYVHTLNQCMLTLERTPDDASALEAMFRAVHSLKGISATMGYDTLATLAHATENVMHKVRDGDWALTSELVDLLFAANDALQVLVNDVAAGGTGDADVTPMLGRLQGYEPEAVGQVPIPAKPVGAQAVVERPRPPVTTIRVDVGHLDTLLDVVTEMVIARLRLTKVHGNLLACLGQLDELALLADALQVHDHLLAQLRDAVLKMRMVPVGQVFSRFPRMVRDLLRAEGKEAQLLIEGEDVELDRTVLEALGDPLVHLLRNAIDHGLETPSEREAAGKLPSGTLRLSARQERGSVIIELRDDGRGMDPQRIAAAAVERGLVAAEEIAEMGEAQVLELICHPGFTLREEVTTVSGRGVGMSVVKREVEALRGYLHIETQVGRGSTFRLQLPAMLALVRALLVSVGSEQYALPTAHVERAIELDPARVERVGDRELIHLESGVLPLCRLGELLGSPGCAPQPRYALLVRRNGHTLGLRVDEVLGHEEIVVRPLPPALRGTPGLAGVTILGDGQVVLILDVMGL